MRRHKWGIWWMVMFAWNAEALGYHLGSDRWWRAALDLLVMVWMGVMAYRDLTMTFAISRPTLDRREYDAAMQRASEVLARDAARMRRLRDLP